MFQKKDITKAIERIEIFYFLIDIVLKDEIREKGVGFRPGMLGSMSSDVITSITDMIDAPTEAMIIRTATSGVQNFYPPMGQTVVSEPQAWQAAEENINATRENSG
ncbi:nuclear transcription factor Y subunit C-4-like [Capsicum annuum]